MASMRTFLLAACVLIFVATSSIAEAGWPWESKEAHDQRVESYSQYPAGPFDLHTHYPHYGWHIFSSQLHFGWHLNAFRPNCCSHCGCRIHGFGTRPPVAAEIRANWNRKHCPHCRQ